MHNLTEYQPLNNDKRPGRERDHVFEEEKDGADDIYEVVRTPRLSTILGRGNWINTRRTLGSKKEERIMKHRHGRVLKYDISCLTNVDIPDKVYGPSLMSHPPMDFHRYP